MIELGINTWLVDTRIPLVLCGNLKNEVGLCVICRDLQENVRDVKIARWKEGRREELELDV